MGIFAKKTSGAEPVVDKISPGLTSTILNTIGLKSIPTLPASADKAFRLSNDPKAELRDFVDVIEADESLSSRILKIANSVYFERGKKSESVEEALNVVGINEVRSLLSATTLSELFYSPHKARMQLWANDVATAIIAKQIASIVLPSMSDSTFLCGLMHDIGKLLLLQQATSRYEGVLSSVREKGISFVEAENEQFAFSHTEVGQLVAEKWNFPTNVTIAIRRHHNPCDDLKTDKLSLIVKAADLVAHALGLGHLQGFGNFQEHAKAESDQALSLLGFNDNSIKDVVRLAKIAFQREYELYAKH